MNKDNVFKSSSFFMAENDVLHLLIIDENGERISVQLVNSGSVELPEDGTPDSPVALDATNVGYTSFSANWEASDLATGYYLDVATDSLFTAPVSGFDGLDVGLVLTYSVQALTQGTAYYYRIRAYNTSDTSTYSNTITLTTEAISYPLLDKDGNEYTTVTIGDQEWIVENFRSTKYADGSDITNGFESYTFLPSDYKTHTFDTFTHSGLNITSAIATSSNKRAAVIECVKEDYGMFPGQKVKVTISNYVLNSGSNPFLYFSSDVDEDFFQDTVEITADGIYYFTAINNGPDQDVGILNYDPLGANIALNTNFSCNIVIEVQAWPDWESYTPAYIYPRADIANVADYGLLYNFGAVDNILGLAYLERGGVQESGWRVPTETDLRGLCVAAGGIIIGGSGGHGYETAGGKLKEMGLLHWDSPNTGAVDSLGFKGIGAGFIYGQIFLPASNFKKEGTYWSSTVLDPLESVVMPLNYLRRTFFLFIIISPIYKLKK